MVQLGIVSWYELNKKYVATKLCENRDKPKMHCNGKCYLKKQLKKTEENSKAPTSKSERFEMVYFIMPAKPFELHKVYLEPIVHNTLYLAGFSLSFSVDVFHPPQQVCS